MTAFYKYNKIKNSGSVPHPANVKVFNFVIGFDSDCYEAGMVEILKEIADEELINHPFIELSAPTKGLIKKAEQSLKIIKGNT